MLLKYRILICTTLFLFLGCTTASVIKTNKTYLEQSEDKDVVNAIFDLTDNSHIAGTLSLSSIPLQTNFAILDIPMEQISNITFLKDNKTVNFNLRNNDKLSGILNIKTIDLTTIFGKVSINIKSIRAMSFYGSGGSLSAQLSESLVLYYSFDEKEDVRITDKSGKGNFSTLNGTEWTPQGKKGGARQFNGKSDYISKEYNKESGLFPVDTPFSIAAWFKTSAQTPFQQMILGTHYAGTGRDGFILWVDTRNQDGKLCWAAYVEGVPVAISQSVVNDGLWHYGVGVWDGKTSSIYVDGVLQGTIKAQGSLVYNYRAPFRIGHVTNNGAPHAKDEFYYFSGTIDEVMMFNIALSADEVKELYH